LCSVERGIDKMTSQTPRPPHPPPSCPAIARVTPMVPEASLFVNGQMQMRRASPVLHTTETVQQYSMPSRMQSTNAEQFHRSPISVGPPNSQIPPSPHLPPTYHLTPQSDLSREFNMTDATLFLNGGNSEVVPPRKVQFQQPSNNINHSSEVRRPLPNVTPPRFTETVQSHQGPVPVTEVRGSVPPDIMSILSWQNEQLAKLQDQVNKLLAASPQGASNTSSENKINHQIQQASPILRKNTESNMVSVSTNTSDHWRESTSAKAPKYQASCSSNDLGKIDCLDLPDYQSSTENENSSETEERLRHQRSFTNSPVLGESASMYERNDIENKIAEQQQLPSSNQLEDILSQVKRLLAQDDIDNSPASDVSISKTNPNQPHVDHPSPSNKNLQPLPNKAFLQDYKTPHEVEVVGNVTNNANMSVAVPPHPLNNETPVTVSTTKATFDMLRQLGVSFISPSDLANPVATTSTQMYNSVFLPHANVPAFSANPSPDTSLAMNNLALKYLTDEELSKLAHQNQTKARTEKRSSQVEHSLASQEFLMRYGLGGTGITNNIHNTQGQEYLPAQATKNNVGQEGLVMNQNPTFRPPFQPVSEDPRISSPAGYFPLHQHQPRFDQKNHQVPVVSRPTLPDLSNRVLDITAIKNQPKLL